MYRCCYFWSKDEYRDILRFAHGYIIIRAAGRRLYLTIIPCRSCTMRGGNLSRARSPAAHANQSWKQTFAKIEVLQSPITGAFSWLNAHASAFRFKTLLRCCQCPNFTSTHWLTPILAQCFNSVLSAKAFNQEKALVGAFSVIVKLQYSRRFVSSSNANVERERGVRGDLPRLY